MNVDLPTSGTHAALVLAGATQTGTVEAAEMAVVLKAAYDLIDDGAGVHDFVPAGDPDRSALVLSDQGTHLFTDASGTHTIPPVAFGTESDDHPTHPGAAFFDHSGVRHYVNELAGAERLEFDLLREADLALDKARTDIVVEGLGGAAALGAVQVDGQTWLTRAATTPPARDTNRNLFGWQSRTEPPRQGVLSNTFDPATQGALPDGDTAVFNNVYRRSTGFATPGNRNTAALPSDALVEVFLNDTASGSPTFAARLPKLARAMRLRLFCGHGPDLAARWRILPRPDLTPDTLVLRPESRTAEVVWRGRWPAALASADRYRAVQIREGGF